jgi:hypothetical protein
MPAFTLWSKGKLIGRAKIMYFPPFPGQRCGDFAPTELGERLMPIMLAVKPAITAFYDFALEARDDAEANGIDLGQQEWPESVRTSTEYADMISAQHEFDTLSLELRDDCNRVVPTEWIEIRDTEQMTREARQIMAAEALMLGLDVDAGDVDAGEFDADDVDAGDADEPEPWDPPPPKYQIMLMLEGGQRLRSQAAAERRRKRKPKSRGG